MGISFPFPHVFLFSSFLSYSVISFIPSAGSLFLIFVLLFNVLFQFIADQQLLLRVLDLEGKGSQSPWECQVWEKCPAGKRYFKKYWMNDPYPQEVCDIVIVMVRNCTHDRRYCHTALGDQELTNLYVLREECLCKTTPKSALRLQFSGKETRSEKLSLWSWNLNYIWLV